MKASSIEAGRTGGDRDQPEQIPDAGAFAVQPHRGPCLQWSKAGELLQPVPQARREIIVIPGRDLQKPSGSARQWRAGYP